MKVAVAHEVGDRERIPGQSPYASVHSSPPALGVGPAPLGPVAGVPPDGGAGAARCFMLGGAHVPQERAHSRAMKAPLRLHSPAAAQVSHLMSSSAHVDACSPPPHSLHVRAHCCAMKRRFFSHPPPSAHPLHLPLLASESAHSPSAPAPTAVTTPSAPSSPHAPHDRRHELRAMSALTRTSAFTTTAAAQGGGRARLRMYAAFVSQSPLAAHISQSRTCRAHSRSCSPDRRRARATRAHLVSAGVVVLLRPARGA